MDLIVSGSKDAILMVECGADGVTEAEVLDALDIAHSEIKKLVGAMEELQRRPARRRSSVEAPTIDEGLVEQITSSHGPRSTRPPASTRSSPARTRSTAIKDAVDRAVRAGYRRRRGRLGSSLRGLDAPSRRSRRTMIRKRIAVDKKRPDGRAQDEIRPIETEVDISPRVHGSALFTRGETQILSNVALGTTRMDMRVDNLGLQETKTFFHHYNFPPFSVGEAGLHARPEAARHRPRRARRARAPADDPQRRRTSPT